MSRRTLHNNSGTAKHATTSCGSNSPPAGRQREALRAENEALRRQLQALQAALQQLSQRN